MHRLRPVEDRDRDLVLDLNERNVAALAPLDGDRLQALRRLSDRFDVVESDGLFAGFVVTFAPGSTYDSENYRWFGERYGEAFYYLDRIVLDEHFRRLGLGTLVYDHMEAAATAYRRLTLEVNLVPPNQGSLAFHAGRGYVEVGRRGHETKLVSLMEKRL